MANTGKQYEKLTQAVFDQIVNTDQSVVNTINVQHNVTLQGNINSHQIDVYWEFEIGGVTYKTLIQAKELNRKVQQSQMETFRSVLDDLPGSTGVFVTNIGYQQGAENLAKACNIKTYVLRNPKNSDWDGYIKTVSIEMHLSSPHVHNLQIIIDGNWANENNFSEAKRCNCYPSEMRIIDQSGVEKTFDKVLYEICYEVGVGEDERERKFDENTFLYFPDNTKMKIFGVKGVFGLHELTNNIVVDAGILVSHILKDVVSGETTMFKKGSLPSYSVKIPPFRVKEVVEDENA